MLNQPIQNSDVIHDTIPSYFLLSFIEQINVPLHFPDFLRLFSFAPMNENRSCLAIILLDIKARDEDPHDNFTDLDPELFNNADPDPGKFRLI